MIFIGYNTNMKKAIICIVFLSFAASFALAQGRDEKSLKDQISSDPSNYSAITELGILYWDKENKRAAISQFRKAIKIYPDGPIPYFYLAEAYYLERKPEKAQKQYDLFEEKMDLIPDKDEELTGFYAEKLNHIGYRYTAMQLEGEAAKTFKKMIKLKPQDPKGHYNLAVCYYQYYNNRPKAYGELSKVIELAPNTRIADKAKLYIDYMRRNPDSRIIGDFTFLDED